MARPIDDIADVIRHAIADALNDRKAELTAIAEAGGEKAGGGLLSDVSDITSIISSIVGPALDVLSFVFPPLGLMREAEKAGGKMGSSFGIGYLLGYSAFSMLQPLLLPIQHAVSDQAQSEIFDPATAAHLESRGLISHEFGRSEAAGGNLSGDHYDKLAIDAQTRPDVITALTMLNRGLITEQNAVEALQHQGYPANWISQLLGLRRLLLSPADLALAELRGELTDETARGYAKQLGVTDEDFTVLINNTGEPLGLEELLEAFRRGFIDEARLDRGIRQSRVRNEWIDVAQKLRYSPMSTSDAVRAVIENYLTDDEGAAIAQQNGLLPDHWRPMVLAFGRPLAHEQMLTLYHRGQATLEQVRQAMRESDVKDKYIEQAIELGRSLVPERTVVSMIDHGVIDHDTGVAMLKERGYNDADADRLVRLGAAQRTTSHKTLSKTDVLAMYTDALMNRSQALAHLAAIGYQSVDANEMLDLAEYKRKASQLRIIERGIQASLKAHHITEQQALSQLTNAGLDHSQAQVLVDEWLQERKVITRTLTEAQTIKAVGDFVITPDDGRIRLQAMGYGNADIDVLYKTAGIMPYQNAWTPVK